MPEKGLKPTIQEAVIIWGEEMNKRFTGWGKKIHHAGVLLVLLTVPGFQACADPRQPVKSVDPDQYGQEHAVKSLPRLPGEVATNGSPLGININSLRDWNTSYPFVDVFKSSRPFRGEKGGGVTLDDKGWVTSMDSGVQAVSPVIYDIKNEMQIKGDYVALYEGKGKLDFSCAKVKSNDPAAKRVVFRVGGGGTCGLYLKIRKTDENDPIRNLHILLPGGVCKQDMRTVVKQAKDCGKGDYLSFEDHFETLVFNPDYLNYVDDFGVLRFMDAGETNGSEVKTWQDRTEIDHANWVKGWPVEIMVLLANTVKADAWFTLPHQSDDDYVRKFAEYVRDHLDPGLNVYIEYSNEVWNAIFSQNRYAMEQGRKLGLDKNKYVAGWKFYSQRSVEIFKVWRDVFNDSERVIRVMATQADNFGLTETLLKHRDASKQTDVVAIAGYFGGAAGSSNAAQTVKMSKDQLFADLNATHLPKLAKLFQKNRGIADKYGVGLVAYEGGQHLVGVNQWVDDKTLEKLLQSVNRDPRMAALYQQMYSDWERAGGGVFVNYSSPGQYSKWGSWGDKEYLMQSMDKAPKYKASIEFININKNKSH